MEKLRGFLLTLFIYIFVVSILAYPISLINLSLAMGMISGASFVGFLILLIVKE